MSSEPLLKRLAKKKKIKPHFVNIEDEQSSSVGNGSLEPKQLISPVEYQSNNYVNQSNNVQPSVPPEEASVPIGLNNDDIRRKFVQKVYGVLMSQITLFAGITALFVYVPHLRKVFRELVFDKLFLGSIIGFPLCLFMILLIVFPSLRRKYAFTTLTILTMCLGLLLSYAISKQSANAFLYSIVAGDICCLGIIGGSAIKKVDFTSFKFISLIPMFMIAASCISPSILNMKFNDTLIPSITTTGLMTYLSLNSRSVIRFNDLKIEPHEYLFAASQLYLHPEQAIKRKVKLLFSSTSTRQQQGYVQI